MVSHEQSWNVWKMDIRDAWESEGKTNSTSEKEQKCDWMVDNDCESD